MTWSRGVLLAIGVALVVGGFFGAWWSGPKLAVGYAHSAEGQVSIESEDWTYGMALDVTWVGEQNTWHHGDRPACVPPSESGISDVHFAWVPVSIEGSEWRDVVWVDCR